MQKQKVLESYEVNLHTMLIVPRACSKDIFSFVKEVDDEFIVLKSPTEIIKHSCIFFGSSYNGRVAGTQALTGITHKPPIAVSPSNKIFFFPTTSAGHSDCAWISHSHVKEIKKAPTNKTTIHFNNLETVTLKISVGSFGNQLYRTAHLKSVYNDRENFQLQPYAQQKATYIHEDEIDEYLAMRIKNI